MNRLRVREVGIMRICTIDYSITEYSSGFQSVQALMIQGTLL